ncbi:MAG: hypothetical protein HZB14_03980 [Actinobacteria bacterium]|nr:hypothetical protein [Actinomycetota bacterium]
MSFLIDGPWLYATGETYARLAAPEERQKNALKRGVTTIAGFYAVSIPLYLNQRWTKPIWKACRAKSGRDWMINSGVLRVDADDVGPRGHKIAAALFATYPLWLWLGYRNGRRDVERTHQP